MSVCKSLSIAIGCWCQNKSAQSSKCGRRGSLNAYFLASRCNAASDTCKLFATRSLANTTRFRRNAVGVVVYIEHWAGCWPNSPNSSRYVSLAVGPNQQHFALVVKALDNFSLVVGQCYMSPTTSKYQLCEWAVNKHVPFTIISISNMIYSTKDYDNYNNESCSSPKLNVVSRQNDFALGAPANTLL